MSVNISIIIVNWNTGELLRRCLDVLPDACAGLVAEVIVVDNASTDQSVAHAEGSAQPFRLFKMKTNVGFARANNVGIRQAGGTTVVLLNPDTEPQTGSLSTLARFLAEHPSAAAVGPRLLNSDHTLQPSCRRFPTTWVLALAFLKVPHVLPSLKSLQRYLMADFAHDVPLAVDQIMGACMAIPQAALTQVGLLDERYWIWFEEVDWCRRARAAHWSVWFTPDAEVVHHGGVSFQQVLPVQKEWRFIRSALRYALKHLGLMSFLILLPLVPLALFLDTASFSSWLRRRNPPRT